MATKILRRVDCISPYSDSPFGTDYISKGGNMREKHLADFYDELEALLKKHNATISPSFDNERGCAVVELEVNHDGHSSSMCLSVVG